MMQQFFAAKEAHPDALLLFRMGDFYELFFDDAVEASALLELTLTSRNKKDDDPIPMAGVPHHALDAYLPRLLAAGRKVAICEQVEDPKLAKGIVKREVVRVVTPGVVLDDNALDRREHNFLCALVAGDNHRMADLAWADVSTGDRHRLTQLPLARALEELHRIGPREVLIDRADAPLAEVLKTRIGRATLSYADVDETWQRPASELLLAYIGEACPGALSSLKPEEEVALERTMRLGATAVRNLELVQTIAGGHRKGSLLGVIDGCKTAMGSRTLKRWLLYPLDDADRIRARHDAVEALVGDVVSRGSLADALSHVYDLERLAGRVSALTAGPRDLAALARSLERIPELRDLLEGSGEPALVALAADLDPVDEASRLIRAALVDEPPATLKDGGVICEGFDDELDELIAVARDGKQWFAEYAAGLREAHGIQSLKVKFNQVFGYFIEVTRANLHLVPDTWVRKQTLANAERYLTAELKEREDLVLGADERRLVLEARFYDNVRRDVAAFSARIRATAAHVAAVDVLRAFADTAASRGYVRPEITTEAQLAIVGGRHPVIEAMMPEGEFVPNDVALDADGDQLLIITGPNMAGKSTVMRQTALIALMAQAGSFVPATRARLGLVDQIFTRVGASDNLAAGQSTFMVEMTEAAEILRDATRRSLVVLDEIGRGTSTFDGVSIAWAVAEHLHDTIGARTLFATHYHELTALAGLRSGIRNMSVAVEETAEDISFLRRLVDGSTNRSYGIQVGKLAGLPKSVVTRAKEVLVDLEALSADHGSQGRQRTSQLNLFPPAPPAQHPAVDRLVATRPDDLSPRAALDLIYELRALVDGER